MAANGGAAAPLGCSTADFEFLATLGQGQYGSIYLVRLNIVVRRCIAPADA